MFGISLDFGQVQTVAMTFFNSGGMSAMLAVVLATGIAGLVLAVLRSVTTGRK